MQKLRHFALSKNWLRLYRLLHSRLICASLHLHRHCPRFIVIIDAVSEQDHSEDASQTAIDNTHAFIVLIDAGSEQDQAVRASQTA